MTAQVDSLVGTLASRIRGNLYKLPAKESKCFYEDPLGGLGTPADLIENCLGGATGYLELWRALGEAGTATETPAYQSLTYYAKIFPDRFALLYFWEWLWASGADRSQRRIELLAQVRRYQDSPLYGYSLVMQRALAAANLDVNKIPDELFPEVALGTGEKIQRLRPIISADTAPKQFHTFYTRHSAKNGNSMTILGIPAHVRRLLIKRLADSKAESRGKSYLKDLPDGFDVSRQYDGPKGMRVMDWKAGGKRQAETSKWHKSPTASVFVAIAIEQWLHQHQAFPALMGQLTGQSMTNSTTTAPVPEEVSAPRLASRIGLDRMKAGMPRFLPPDEASSASLMGETPAPAIQSVKPVTLRKGAWHFNRDINAVELTVEFDSPAWCNEHPCRILGVIYTTLRVEGGTQAYAVDAAVGEIEDADDAGQRIRVTLTPMGIETSLRALLESCKRQLFYGVMTQIVVNGEPRTIVGVGIKLAEQG